MPEICDMAHFDEERWHVVYWETRTFWGKSHKNSTTEQIKEKDHVTNENGACQIRFKTCRIIFKIEIFVRTNMA